MHVSQADRLDIEATVEHYRREIVRMSRILNAGSLVMRLPGELLAHIFHFYCIAWHIESSSERLRRRCGWIWLTHICHHWREVALNTPSLWTEIDVACSTTFISAFISRSGALPLQVQGSFVQWAEMSLETQRIRWDPLLRVSDRVHSLRVEILDFMPRFPSLSTSEQSFSELKTLELRYMSYTPEDLPDIVPPSLPTLRALTTDWVSIHTIKRISCPSLTSLSLRDFGIATSQDSETWTVLLQALAHMPKLAYLTLEDAFLLPPDFLDLPLLIGQAVTLPVLQSLRILSYPWFGAGAGLLLRNLCFPGNAPFEIRHANSFLSPAGSTQVEDEVRCLAVALDLRLSGPIALDLPPSILTLQTRSRMVSQKFIAPANLDVIELQGWSSVIDLDGCTLEADGGLIRETTSPNFVVEWCPAGGDIHMHLFRIQSFAQVRTLVIDSTMQSWLQPEYLSKGFIHMRQLSTLVVTGDSVETLLEGLLLVDQGETLFPSLKKLGIFDFDVADPNEYDLALPCSPQRHELLIGMAYGRDALGYRLDMLRLTDCALSPRCAEQLRAYVEELVWSGTRSRDS